MWAQYKQKKELHTDIHNKNQPTQIEDIPVTSSFVYLGVTLQNKRDCYKLHRIESMNKAKKYSNLMPAVIAKSGNKLLIGKTYWKSAALPSILHGTEVIFLSKKYIADLQTVENKALRYTVNARKATAISALRGEIWFISTDFQRYEVKDFLH